MKVLGAKDVKYFYVAIPNQPNVKLSYSTTAPGATPRFAWTGSWTIPASYPAGVVPFKVLVKATSKRQGSFVQIPVATSQLSVSPSALVPYGNGPAAAASTAPAAKSDLGIYVDTVNGSAPVGAAKRPVGCAQTNDFKRGEQVVIRVWGFDLKSGDTLSNDNVDTATATVPGLSAPLTLGYSGHGTPKIYFCSSPFIVPATFPLGDVTIHVAFKTTDGKSGTFDYPITIVP
jgi:hypothetical protein